MSQKPDLSDIYERLGLSRAVVDWVEAVCASDPVRRVRGGKRNTVVRVRSPSTGEFVQLESTYAELGLFAEIEFDKLLGGRHGVRFYRTQAQTLRLHYKTATGRRRTIRHTPDFFLACHNSIHFTEVKTLADAEQLQARTPERMHQDPDGTWRSLAGEAAAAEYGVGYRVHVDAGENTYLIRNLRFLWSYYRSQPPRSQKAAIDAIHQTVNEHRSVRVLELVENHGAEPVHYAIAHGYVHFPLWSDLLPHRADTRVYSHPAYAAAMDYTAEAPAWLGEKPLHLSLGKELEWDRIKWEVINAGETTYTLRDPEGRLRTLAADAVQQLIRDGHISAPTGNDPNAARAEALQHLPAGEQLNAAVRRAQLLDAYKRNERWPLEHCAKRTLDNWARRWREAELVHNDGFRGLIDRRHRQGNSDPRLTPQSEAILQQSLEEDYRSSRATTVAAAYREYCSRAQQAHVDRASLETYRRRAHEHDRQRTVAKRSGAKAAYQLGPEALHTDDLEKLMPRHGDHAYGVVHIDHTKLPVDLLPAINESMDAAGLVGTGDGSTVESAKTGESFGTPWLSAMLDAYSRSVLAHVLTYEQPSVRTLMALFRDCVRRNKRLMNAVVVDHGPEFQSNYFEALLYRYHIQKIERPPGAPRHGSVIESLFGTTEAEVTRALTGTTRNRDLDRSLSKSHDPRRQARWTIDELDDLLETYFYELYDNRRHTGMDDTPARVRSESIAERGNPEAEQIPYDEQFLIHTLVPVDGVTRKVRKGGITVQSIAYRPVGGGVANYEGRAITVLHDPDDPTHVYGWLGNAWQEFIADDTRLRHVRDCGIRHTGYEVAARAANSRRSYRNPSAAHIRFGELIKEREARLARRRDLEGCGYLGNDDKGSAASHGQGDPSSAQGQGRRPAVPLSPAKRSGGTRND